MENEQVKLIAATRAWQIWPVLVTLAKHNMIITYGELSELIGYPKANQGLRHTLEHIQQYCIEKGLPKLTSLVVSQENGEPGGGFLLEGKNLAQIQIDVFKRAKELIHELPGSDGEKYSINAFVSYKKGN